MAITDFKEVVEVGTSSNYDTPAKTLAIKNLAFGVTAGGTALPLKITDDGTGRGKLDVTME